MTSVPPTQPPAAPETDVSRRRAIRVLDCNAADLHSEVKLTAAEEDAIENAWVAAPKDGPAASRDPMYAAVERIVAERLRVVEGERDRWLRLYEGIQPDWERWVARAESAEAAHEALRKGIWALGESIHGDEGVEHVEGCEGEPTCFACILSTLRTLLTGGAS